MAPAMGVPNTVAKPALIPQITSFLRSFSSNRSNRANSDDSPAPIWAHGPSLPADPPAARVMRVATSLTGTTAAGMTLPCLWIASITFSVPWPCASGATRVVSRVLIQNASGRRRKVKAYRSPCIVAHDRRRRNAVVARPTMTPVQDPSTIHLMTLANRTDCSVMVRFILRPENREAGGGMFPTSPWYR